MIVSLELTAFRRHEHLSLNLTQGMNVLRGGNEQGKTTVIEAVLYALYGSKALRTSFVDAVTWGRKESELKVALVLRVSGVDYTFTRSKAGAEVNYDGGKVTGQVEVSNFATSLLGADAKVASMLMLASQNGLRGALDEGATAVSALMGNLADFDVIDRILETASNTLALGAEAPWATKVTEAEKEVADAAEALAQASAIDTLIWKVENLEQHRGALSEQADALQDAMTDDQEKLDEAKAAASAHASALAGIAALDEEIARSKQALSIAEEDAAKVPDADRIAALRTAIEGSTKAQQDLDAYRALASLAAYPDAYWDRPKEDFDAEFESIQAQANKIDLRLREINGEAKQLDAGRVTNGKCPTCGSTKVSDEHVVRINAEIDAKVAVLAAEQQGLRANLNALNTHLTAMKAIKVTAEARDRTTSRIAAYLSFDTSVYPSRVSWAWPVPEVRDYTTMRSELAKLNDQAQKAAQAAGRVEVLTASLASLNTKLVAAEETRAKMVVPDLKDLTVRAEASYQAYAAASKALADVTKEVQAAQAELAEARRIMADGQKRHAQAQARVAQAQADLKTLQFNNGFVKKLKSLKPVVTDHLWSTVLAAVSGFFTQMRGEQSVVTKDGGGFKVNGQSVESLSGSTLDALGLAIRVALSKTFVPHASFLLLDEPAHGCDSDRTGNVLGFLHGCGFDQVLIASHDEMSESVADNVVVVGEQ